MQQSSKRSGAGQRAAMTRKENIRRSLELAAREAAALANVGSVNPEALSAVSGRLSTIERTVASKVDAAQVAALIEATVPKPAPVIRVEIPERRVSKTVEGRQHVKFPALLRAVGVGMHVWLVGPAGSGKTHSAEEVAKQLGLKFTCQSVGQQTSKADLLGFISATGKYVPGVLRDPVENGGLLLLDEIDSGNANVLTILNSLLANGYCAFPDGMIRAHKDFVFIGSANTWGVGADRLYCGRNQLDAASLTRFAFIEWPYDEELELQLSCDQRWTTKVQAYRRAAIGLQLRVVISPRASINGGKLLAAGFPEKEVEAMVLFQGMDAAAIGKLRAAVVAQGGRV